MIKGPAALRAGAGSDSQRDRQGQGEGGMGDADWGQGLAPDTVVLTADDGLPPAELPARALPSLMAALGDHPPSHVDIGLLPPTLRRPPPTYDRLAELIRSHLSDADQERIARAYRFAETAHAGQTRKSGEPFITHPLAVTIILAEMGLFDADTLVAALLHDVIEDCGVGRAVLAKDFGEPVA